MKGQGPRAESQHKVDEINDCQHIDWIDTVKWNKENYTTEPPSTCCNFVILHNAHRSLYNSYFLWNVLVHKKNQYFLSLFRSKLNAKYILCKRPNQTINENAFWANISYLSMELQNWRNSFIKIFILKLRIVCFDNEKCQLKCHSFTE